MIDTLKPYIKFEKTKLFHWTWKIMVKCKTCHRKMWNCEFLERVLKFGPYVGH
jgi:hypothetical protein